GSSNTSLIVTDCTPGSDIFNVDGTLECSAGGTLPPSGSYQASCRFFRTRASTLIAQCKNDNGSFVGQPQGATQLSDFHRCIADILNFDGQLACTTASPIPGGSYAQSCSEIWFDSGILHAHCRRSDGSSNKTQSAASPGSS